MNELTEDQKKDVLNKHKEILLALLDQTKAALEKQDEKFIQSIVMDQKAYTGVMAGRYWSYQLNMTVTPTKELKDKKT